MDNTKGLAFFGRGSSGEGWTWEDQEVGEIGIHKARFPNNQLKTNLKRIANENSQLASITLFSKPFFFPDNSNTPAETTNHIFPCCGNLLVSFYNFQIYKN